MSKKETFVMIQSGGMGYYQGKCNDCGILWGSKNVIGLAARHAQLTGHSTWSEIGLSYHWKRP